MSQWVWVLELENVTLSHILDSIGIGISYVLEKLQHLEPEINTVE